MTDFLLELRSEEIPARMQARARADLARLFTEQLSASGLTATSIETHATPRRLALIARGLPDATQSTSEEIKGPRADAPPQALAGFLGKVGLTRDQLVERADAKGNIVLFAVLDRSGRPTADVLAAAIPAIVQAFPWPKSMRWGDASTSTESLRWVRPLQGIVALLGEQIVPCEVAGIASGAATVGHRFHHPGIITIGGADDYEAKLRACHVILDADERATIIRDGATAAAAAAGLTLVPDEGLVVENAGLTEWPVPLLGRFDPAFLDVPREVIQLTMRTNQKYFALTDANGALAPAFICTANIAATDGGAAIVAGNERVLSARLADAKFFWEADLKVPLEDQAAKLDQIVFHEKLGTVADKVDRVAKLARWLIEQGIVRANPLVANSLVANPPAATPPVATPPRFVERSRDTLSSAAEITELKGPNLAQQGLSTALEINGEGASLANLATLTERAARLCKADLVTQMVGEFPELQGTIGGYLASAQGEDPRICAAIRDHYKPVGQGDDVPTAPVTVAVSLADKLDTIAAFFALREVPTGSKDPFALRRSAISILRLLEVSDLRMPVAQTIIEAVSQMPLGQQPLVELEDSDQEFVKQFGNVADDPKAIFGLLVSRHMSEFIAARLAASLKAAGKRSDFIDAVFYTGTNDFVSMIHRAGSLQAFVETSEGRDLLAGYKRAANILKKENYPSPLQGRGGSGEAAEGEGAVESLTPNPATSDRPRSPPGEREQKKSLSYTPEPAEEALTAALDSAEPRVLAAIGAEDFAAAMTALAFLRAPVDLFFETVIVNDPDPVKRDARLALLARMRAAVHGVADFSKIEG